ncbi:hypothetical protein BJ322DRAFT_1111676 [Thelephora terrestris]|uniref:Uncharacterized protein n=1 Tax=Thelephora terrestris TaxID=56493 RepID=A0A9P6H8J6_9AGAM|nr:hypothetical protein BJ322DRAFT_1111676 [Thelephora terrestris]
MPSELNPSGLTPQDLSKLNKKALIENLTALQGLYTTQGKKYEKAKSIIRSNKATTDAQSANAELIPQPSGRRSRDFNIFEEMQYKGKVEVSKETYNSLINYIHFAVKASKIDMGLPLKDQETVEVVRVIASVQEQFPFIAKYRNAWPVILLMRQFQNNRRNHQRALAAANRVGAAAAAVAPDLNERGNNDGNEGGDGALGNDNNNNNDEDEDESNIIVSDIDD